METTKNMPHAQVMELDKSLAKSFIEKSDFMEGIRTRIITKKNNPTWIYHFFAEISPAIPSDFLFQPQLQPRKHFYD